MLPDDTLRCCPCPVGSSAWPPQLRPGQKYSVSVTAAKDSRNVTRSLTITPMPKPLPSGTVIRNCGLFTQNEPSDR